MAGIDEDRDRRVVPRWRCLDATIRAGETASVRPSPGVRSDLRDDFDEALHEWSLNKGLSLAADIVSSSLVLGRTVEAKEAAELVISCTNAPATAKSIAERVLGQPRIAVPPRGPADSIRAIKERLRDEPRNPCLWVDLALFYIMLGQHKQGIRSIEIALGLARDNRFVVRSASRCFLHIGDARRAHDLLRSSSTAQSDPWIMSAEIATATAAKRQPAYVKKARGALDASRFSMLSKSELFSALGSLEVDAGNTRKARRLFESSLDQPTENAVAQAVWVSERKHLPLQIPADVANISHEGLAQRYRALSDWGSAIAQAEAWFCDQPFSSRPPMLGSYLAGVVLGDYVASARLAELGLAANPDDFILLNNRAFALLQADQTVTGSSMIRSVHPTALSDLQRVVWLATMGLAAYRQGNPELGIEYYSSSIAQADRLKMIKEKCLALVYFALEEVRAGGSQSRELRGRALENADKLNDPEVEALIKRVGLRND